MKRTISKLLILLALFLFLGTSLYARPIVDPPDPPQGNIEVSTEELDFLPGEDKELDRFVINILDWIIGAATLVCVVMLVYSGYMYMTAGGDEQKVQTAQKTITGSLIGLAISLLSLVIVNFVLETFLGQQHVG